MNLGANPCICYVSYDIIYDIIYIYKYNSLSSRVTCEYGGALSMPDPFLPASSMYSTGPARARARSVSLSRSRAHVLILQSTTLPQSRIYHFTTVPHLYCYVSSYCYLPLYYSPAIYYYIRVLIPLLPLYYSPA